MIRFIQMKRGPVAGQLFRSTYPRRQGELIEFVQLLDLRGRPIIHQYLVGKAGRTAEYLRSFIYITSKMKRIRCKMNGKPWRKKK